jgi:transcriptional regulator with XRE-family HTH domain
MWEPSDTPGEGLIGSGRHYAEKFHRLLEQYPRPDGRKWRGRDLERATNGFVNGSYVTALKKGRIDRPGLDKLRRIAEVMGFPFELWLEDPSDWRRLPEAAGRPEDESGTLADLLNQLFETVVDPRSGRPYTNAEVSAFTQGRLSAEEIEQMRAGTLRNPNRDQLLALSDAFDIDPSYWFGRGERRPVLDPELAEALRNRKTYALLHKSLDLDDDDKDIVMVLMDQLGRR